MKAKRYVFIVLSLLFSSFIFPAAMPDEESQMREKIRKNISTLRLLRMTQALDLTEEQSAKIYPFVSRIDREKMEIQKQISRGIKELKSLLSEEEGKEDKITEKVKSINDLRNLLKERDKELENFLENNLTPMQRAKYILFSVEFSRGLREKLDRARLMRMRSPQKEKRMF